MISYSQDVDLFITFRNLKELNCEHFEEKINKSSCVLQVYYTLKNFPLKILKIVELHFES